MEKGIKANKKIGRAKMTKVENVLCASKHSLASLMDFSPDATLAIDKDKRVIIWNRAIEKMSGVPASKMIGQGDYAYTVPFYGFARPQLMDLFWLPKHKIAKEYPMLKKEGKNLVGEAFCPALHHGKGAYIWVKGSPIQDSKGKLIGAIECIRDITDRKKAEQKIVSMNRALRMLSNSNQALIHAVDEKKLLEKVCRIIVNIGGYRLAWVGFAESDKAKTIRPVAQAGLESGYVKSVNLTWADTVRGRDSSGAAIRTGQPSVSRNIMTNPATSPWRTEALKRGLQSSIALPLIDGKRVIGMLAISSGKPDAFGREEISLLNEFAADLSFGIMTLRARAESRFLEKELQMIFDNSADGILLAEATSGRFLRANRSICRMLGYRHDDIKKLSVSDIHPQEHLPFILKQFDDLANGRASVASNIPMKRRDGSVFCTDINTSIIKIDGKKYVLGMFRDITKSKKYEEALIFSETKYRRLFEAAKDGILILDAESGEIKEVNPYLIDMLGYSRKKFLQKKLWEIGLFKDIVASKKSFEELKRKKYIHYENLPLRTKAGQAIHVEFVSNVYSIDHSEVIQCNIRDISARYDAEQEIANNEARFRAIYEDNPIAIVLINLDNGFIGGNQAAIGLWGYSEAELRKMTLNQVAHPKELPKSLAQIKRLIKGELNVYRDHNRYIKKDKSVIYTRVNISLIKGAKRQPLYFLAIIEDITEHHQWEKAVRKSEEKYSTLVEQSSDGVLVIQDGLIKFGNKAIQEITGYDLRSVIGRPVVDFISLKYKKLVVDRYTQRLKGAPTASRYEFELIKKNNEPLFVETNSSLIEFDNHPAVMAVIRDISRAKKIEKIKSEFISVASHQLRTPLTGIKWLGQLLIDQKVGELSGKQLDFIRQIYNSNERMIRLVSDLLDVSRIETGHKFTIEKRLGDIISLTNEVVSDQRIISPESEIKIISDKPLPDKLEFDFDRDKIYQVLANLINNAIKYSGKNKKIIISFKRLGDTAQVSIQDFGFGIPESQKARVFQKFFRADNISTVSTEGTGLGLYIAKSIVEAHGGKMWFESEQDQGTTFYFILPLK
ncbi:MAG: PAS domain S-box protein [Patescibacteria group bacterium]|jgi:PAS domain S-box-containing protein